MTIRVVAKTCPLVFAACASIVLVGCGSSQSARTEIEAAPARGTLDYDKSIFHDLLIGHGAIRRSVHEIDGGIEATTESDDPAIAAKLADHVGAMKLRMENGLRVRQWDPLFIAMFDHREAVRLDFEKTEKGVRVRETSSDPRVVALIRAHAGVVSGFAANGGEEASREHPVPEAAQVPAPNGP